MSVRTIVTRVIPDQLCFCACARSRARNRSNAVFQRLSGADLSSAHDGIRMPP